ncbi:MAG: sulfatase-like hydrolase/transferase [Verrucomicrobiia bacterium]|jgi:arylsulfatase A-like enzyme
MTKNRLILCALCAFVVQASAAPSSPKGFDAAKPHSDGTAIASPARTSPNIVFILADDMGYGDCSAYNPQSKFHTPNSDRLAKEGLLFTDAHSASATCTASRYGLLTGINPARRGVVNGICAVGPVLEKKEVTVAELLRQQGYVTRMFGKWHLGFEMKPAKPRPVYDFAKPFHGGPLDHGFNSFLGLRQAVSGAPYFYIRDRKVEAEPTETTKGTKNSAKAAGKDSRTAYGSGSIAPGFVPEECNARLNDEVVQTLRKHAAIGEKANPLFLYYATLKLKPLAEQVRARRAATKARSKTKTKPARKSQTTEKDPDEIRRQRTELMKKLDSLLTAQQKQAQAGARKKALAEGKGGVALRKAMDAALSLTPDQKKQFDKLRKEISDLTRELRD